MKRAPVTAGALSMEGKLKKILFMGLIFLMLLVSSCQTLSENTGGITNAISGENKIIADFTGYTGHHSTIEKEEAAAKDDIIRQVLMEEKLIVNLYHYQRQTTVNTASFGKMDYYWSEKHAEALREEITIKEYDTNDKGTKAYADYKGNPAFKTIPAPAVWSIEAVKINGYRCFTGIAEGLSTEAKSVREADNDALEQAVKYIALSITDEVDNYDSKHFSFTSIKTKEEAVLVMSGFRVIDRWENGGIYYSLAVIPE